MKRIFIALVACALSVNSVFAQEAYDSGEGLKSKRGITILPEPGDWALGISANPFLNYLGNVFNGNQNNNSPSFSYVNNPANNVALFGKYVLDENTFYRARMNVGIGQNIDKAVVNQNLLTPPDPRYPVFTEDWRKRSNATVVLAFGIEKRRGTSRVQGLYGGELVTGFSRSNATYQYGNPITQDFNNPITHNFGNNLPVAGSRVIEQNNGNFFRVGARGFVGVEYFIAPKISLGGEFGYELGFQTQGRASVTTESWNNATGAVLETTTDYFNNNFNVTSFGLGLDNLNGSINLLFYF